jgi:hypothetical protein
MLSKAKSGKHYSDTSPADTQKNILKTIIHCVLIIDPKGEAHYLSIYGIAGFFLSGERRSYMPQSERQKISNTMMQQCKTTVVKQVLPHKSN